MATSVRYVVLTRKVNKLDKEVRHYVGTLQDIKVTLATMDLI